MGRLGDRVGRGTRAAAATQRGEVPRLIADVLHNLITCSWGAGTRSNRHCEIGGRNIEARQQDEKLKQKPAENSGVKKPLGLLCWAKGLHSPRLSLSQPQI